MSALQFLLLEANLPNAEVVQATLREGGIDCELLRVDTRAAFIRALESNAIDLILADYALSNFDEIAALTIARRLRPEIPFIFISGSLGEELAIEAIKQGATDYVLKQRLGRLVPSVQRAVQEVPEDKDIIDRKQALSAIESDLKDTQLLHELSARLVTEGEIQTLYQEIIAAAIAFTRADAGSIQILDEATQELVMLATQGLTPEILEHFHRVNASHNTSCGMALTMGDRAFVDFDVPESEDPDGSMRLHLEAGYISAQSTPLITRSGKAIGIFSTHWCKHHRPTERELRFLDLLARQAADLIEQRQAEASLRESEAKYRSLFNSIDEGFCVFEMIYDETPKAVDYHFLEVNQIFEQQTGLKNVVGKLGSEIAPNTESYWLEIYDNVLKTGNPQRIENYNQSTERWYEAYASRVGGADNRQVCTVFNDITDRKRSEEQLRRAAQMDAFRVKLSDALRSLSDCAEIQGEAARLLREQLDVGWCYYNEFNETGTVATILQDAVKNGLPSAVGVHDLSDVPEFTDLLHSGSMFNVSNFATFSLFNPRVVERYTSIGMYSVLGAPLVKNGRLIAVFLVADTSPREWTDEAIALLQDVAERTWAAVERARAEESLRESEAKYRSLFENVNDGFCIIEMLYDNGQPINYRFLEVNPAFETQSGFKQAIGKTAHELTPNLEAVIFTNYETVLTTGEPIEFEIQPVDIGRYLRVAAYRYGDPQNKQLAIVFSDISERKQAEEQLRRTAEMDAFRVKLSDALRSLTDTVQIQAEASRLLGEHLSVDRAYYVEVVEAEGYTCVNQNYLRGDSPSLVGVYRLVDYGWTVPFLLRGETIIVADAQTSDIIPEADREVMAAIRIAAHITVPLIKAGTLVGSLCVTESAPREWLTAEIELVRETAERVWATIIRARAETELRKSEIQRVLEQSAREEERQRAETLAELDRAKTLFFSNVSHEFRTPLTLILAPLQDALSDLVNPLTSSQREQLELAHRNSLRLLKLVNTLLDFSRIEADRLKANYEPTDLSNYTAELASVFRSAIENANLQLVVDSPPLPDPIYVDREMWEKIVLNLLSNALKFTFDGMISVSLKSNANTVELIVSDTGVGISASELPHLFERFYQVKGAKGRSYEGSGIGLSLVQELVKRHGGAIAVTSAVDQGTTFTVTIPTGIAHLPAHQIEVASTLPSTAVRANAFVEEALRWLPEQEEGGRGRFQG